jgi:ergothioneine biosynthesis protein EgtB
VDEMMKIIKGEIMSVNDIQTQSSATLSVSRKVLIEQYKKVRSFSEQLCAPLVAEDYVIQSMPDGSPTKWHLAHVTWFWETFLLSVAKSDYKSPYPQYAYLFNSYYNSLGKRHSRPLRGLISRPTVQETYQYRAFIDEQMLALLEDMPEEQLAVLAPTIIIGFNHEQQHQELILTDIKHVLACNPLHPVYLERMPSNIARVPSLEWVSYPEGVYWIGHDEEGFYFDNEGPQHRQFVQSFQLASRLVTNGEYLEFIEDGGYKDPLLWLSEGWNIVQTREWQAPLYWEKQDGDWWVMTLHGFQKVDKSEPVCHVSYFEADAYARWAQARLATEAEWEVAARDVPIEGNFVDKALFHPSPLQTPPMKGHVAQMYGDVWEWTQSSYSPYPGYKPAPGAIGEYNGKFMSNQYVLRGGSCATSLAHIRSTYRNFFPSDARWQFMGIRLAREV